MKLHRINNCPVAAIVIINLYVIAAPLTPAIFFWWQNRSGEKQQLLAKKIHAAPEPAQPPNPGLTTSQPNGLIIPSMLLDQPILEGSIKKTYDILDKGIWRWPNGSSPDKGGNTVLIGHRFTYTQPKGVFYYLNKVKVGDELAAVWNNQTYRYKVTTIKVVPATEVSIQDPTTDAQLTIFTCTPLWLPKDRLVVIAKLETNP